MLHRYAAIIDLLQFQCDIKFKQLPQGLASKFREADFTYSEQRERLLFLHSADVITENCLKKLLYSKADLSDVLIDLEDYLLLEEPKAVNSEIVGNALLMCSSFNNINSIFSPISFKAAFELANICASSTELISFDGEVISYNNDLTNWLYDIGEPLSVFKGNVFVEAREKDTEMFLKDVRKLPFILNYYKKLYGKEFIIDVFQKGDFDPSKTDLERSSEYSEFLTSVKLKFDITGYLRKRNICDFCNILDYRQNIIVDGKLVDSKMTPDSDYKRTIQLSLKEISSDLNKPTPDKELCRLALARYEENNLMGDEKLVVEVMNNKKRLLFSYEKGIFEEIDIDAFETVPFNYDKVWTFVQEASKEKQIRVSEGKLVITMEADKKYEMSAEEMVYAERMIKDQLKRQRAASPLLTRLSELIRRAREKPESEGSGKAGGVSAAPKPKDRKASDEI